MFFFSVCQIRGWNPSDAFKSPRISIDEQGEFGRDPPCQVHGDLYVDPGASGLVFAPSTWLDQMCPRNSEDTFQSIYIVLGLPVFEVMAPLFLRIHLAHIGGTEHLPLGVYVSEASPRQSRWCGWGGPRVRVETIWRRYERVEDDVFFFLFWPVE